MPNGLSLEDKDLSHVNTFLLSDEQPLFARTCHRFFGLSKESDWLKQLVTENSERFHTGLMRRLKSPLRRHAVTIDELQALIRTPDLNFKLRFVLLLYQLKLSYQDPQAKELVLRRIRLLTNQSLYGLLTQLMIAQWENDKAQEKIIFEKIWPLIHEQDNVQYFMFFPEELLKEKFRARLQEIKDYKEEHVVYCANVFFSYADIYYVRKCYPDFISDEEWDILLKNINKSNYIRRFENFPSNKALDLISHFQRLKLPVPFELLSILPLEQGFPLIRDLFYSTWDFIRSVWPPQQWGFPDEIDTRLRWVFYFCRQHKAKLSNEQIEEILCWLKDFLSTEYDPIATWAVSFFKVLANRIDPEKRNNLIYHYAEKFNNDNLYYIRLISLLNDNEKLQKALDATAAKIPVYEWDEFFPQLNLVQQEAFLKSWLDMRLPCWKAKKWRPINPDLLERVFTEKTQGQDNFWCENMIWLAVKRAKPLSLQQLESFVDYINHEDKSENIPSLENLKVWLFACSSKEIDKLMQKIIAHITNDPEKNDIEGLSKLYLELARIQADKLSESLVFSHALDVIQTEADKDRPSSYEGNARDHALIVLQSYLPLMNMLQKENFVRSALKGLTQHFAEMLLQIKEPSLCNHFFTEIYRIKDSWLMNFRFLLCNAWYPYLNEENVLHLVEPETSDTCQIEPRSIQPRVCYLH